MTRADRVYLAALLFIVTAVGLRALLADASYIGQDFVGHRGLTLTYPREYSYVFTNPPGLYWLGAVVNRYVSSSQPFEFTVLVFLILNAAALWILYEMLWRSIELRPVRYAAAALITFIPFRQIHTVVYASDALTIPLFAAAAYYTLRLYHEPRRIAYWTALSLALSLGVLTKYSLVGTLPPIAVILAVALWKSGGWRSFLPWLAAPVIALGLPAWIFRHQMNLTYVAKGNSPYGQWLKPGDPPVMRWRDILLPQRSDLGVLAAPQYFRDRVFEDRKYSYIGLIHVSTFTDISNFFQPVPASAGPYRDQWERKLFERERTERADVLQRWAVRWSVPLTLLAIVGTIFCGIQGLRTLFSRRVHLHAAALVLGCLAAGAHAVILVSLPRLNDPYTPGFWLPRLVMPSLLVFYALGFVAADSALRRWIPRPGVRLSASLGLALYTGVACALFVGFLV